MTKNVVKQSELKKELQQYFFVVFVLSNCNSISGKFSSEVDFQVEGNLTEC